MLKNTETMDFEAHNAEVRAVWAAFHEGKPIRVPMILGINPRFTMGDHPSNPRQISFETYMSDPQVMLERQVEHLDWVRHFVPQDAEMGLPVDGWSVYVDLQDLYEPGWYGAEPFFPNEGPPVALPLLDDDHNKHILFDRGLPDPFTGGIMAKNWEFYEYFQARKQEGWTYKDISLGEIQPMGLLTQGPLTVAIALRGADRFLLDIYQDSDYFHQLMDYLTRAIILRIRAFRQRLGLPVKQPQLVFTDDTIEMISVEMYRELVLPYHRRLVDALGEGGPHWIHLCGDASRHFRTLCDELNVGWFDTGFPIDLAQVREDLGPDVVIYGGPHVGFLVRATPMEVEAEVKSILRSRVTQGGKFILREANNLPPGVPLENLWAMYDACKRYGRFNDKMEILFNER